MLSMSFLTVSSDLASEYDSAILLGPWNNEYGNEKVIH